MKVGGLRRAVHRARQAETLHADEPATLLQARGADLETLCATLPGTPALEQVARPGVIT